MSTPITPMKRWRQFVRTPLYSLLALAACACAPALADQAALTIEFGAALRCETDFPDARDPAVGERLRRLGAVVIDRAPGENLDLLYLFPQSLMIDGTEVASVTVRGTSGSIVSARAFGDMHAFTRRMKANPHPMPSWGLDGYGEISARYVRTMPPRPKLDETAPMLVIGPAPELGSTAFRWGCRSFDD